jgi:hypothetical protein
MEHKYIGNISMLITEDHMMQKGLTCGEESKQPSKKSRERPTLPAKPTATSPRFMAERPHDLQ